jgi:hypothetical protein
MERINNANTFHSVIDFPKRHMLKYTHTSLLKYGNLIKTEEQAVIWKPVIYGHNWIPRHVMQAN